MGSLAPTEDAVEMAVAAYLEELPEGKLYVERGQRWRVYAGAYHGYKEGFGHTPEEALESMGNALDGMAGEFPLTSALGAALGELAALVGAGEIALYYSKANADKKCRVRQGEKKMRGRSSDTFAAAAKSLAKQIQGKAKEGPGLG